MPSNASICVTCGTQYPPSAAEPARCAICEDDRQYINPGGQQWTTLAAMHGAYTNRFTHIAPGLTAVVTQPTFAIGQRAYLIQTAQGNVLWDCISYLDDASIEQVRQLGGIAAIAISHPHFFSSMGEWSHAFGDAPIYLHRAHEPWVMNPHPAIRYFDSETVAVLPGVTVVRCGGHFPGSSVLHWSGGEDGAGALFAADTISVCPDPRWLSFMYSFPNRIPLDEATVRSIVAAVEPFAFDRIFGMDSVTPRGAKAAVARSAERYTAHLRGGAGAP